MRRRRWGTDNPSAPFWTGNNANNGKQPLRPASRRAQGENPESRPNPESHIEASHILRFSAGESFRKPFPPFPRPRSATFRRQQRRLWVRPRLCVSQRAAQTRGAPPLRPRILAPSPPSPQRGFPTEAQSRRAVDPKLRALRELRVRFSPRRGSALSAFSACKPTPRPPRTPRKILAAQRLCALCVLCV